MKSKGVPRRIFLEFFDGPKTKETKKTLRQIQRIIKKINTK